MRSSTEARECRERTAPEAGERPRCAILTDIAELDALADEWHRLWAQCPSRNVFTTFAWIRACWETNASERRLHAPVIFEGPRVVSILPLALRGRALVFLGHGHSDYNDILVEEGREMDALSMSFDHLLRSRAPWSACVLENVPEGSALFRAASRLPGELRSRLVATFAATCPKLEIDAAKPDEIAGILKKNKLKYYQKRLENLGKLEFRHLEDKGEIDAHLASFFRQYRCRRAMAGDLDRPRHEKLYRLMRSVVVAIDHGAGLRFGVLELDGRPIAYYLGFLSDGRLIYYKPTFDINYWDYSVGQVLLKKILEYARNEGLREVDFTVGDEDYKSRFTNRRGTVFTLSLYRSRASTDLRRLGEAVKDRIRRRPGAFSIAQSIKAHARGGLWGLSGTLLRGAAARARRTIYRRDAVLVSSRTEHPSPVTAAPQTDDGRLEIRVGALDQLAALAFEHPEEFTPGLLHRARERLKHGDRPILACRGEEVLLLVWVGLRAEIQGLDVGWDDASSIPLSEKAVLVHGRWASSRFDGPKDVAIVMEALLASEFIGPGAAWFVDEGRPDRWREALAAAGFRPAFRVIRTCLLGRRAWIRTVEAVPHTRHLAFIDR